jgi:SET domain-containing protein
MKVCISVVIFISLLLMASKNIDHVIDANRAGNKFRFVNHSRLGENCAPRVVFANGVHRIGMYARRDLVVGEELYFNYKWVVSLLRC